MAGGVGIPFVGGPTVAVGVRDWVAIETGANLYAPWDRNDQGLWGMGYLGPRFTKTLHRDSSSVLAFDFEAGFGAGAGGACGTNCAPTSNDPKVPPPKAAPWTDRPAFGGYQGIGFGGTYKWFGAFLRLRLEESTATGLPLTLWPSAMLGAQFEVSKNVSFYLGGGYMGFFNGQDHENGFFDEIGVILRFDMIPKKR